MQLVIVEAIERRGEARSFLAWDASQASGPFARRYESAWSAYAGSIRRVRHAKAGTIRFLDRSGHAGTYREVRVVGGRLAEVVGVRNWAEVGRRRFR